MIEEGELGNFGDGVWYNISLHEYGGMTFVLPESGMVLLKETTKEEEMGEDLYAREREFLIESDPIELADEVLKLREKLKETEYEYAVLRYRMSTGELLKEPLVWMTKEEAQSDLDLLGGSSRFYDYRLKKRRKAGEVEDA